MYGAGRRVQGGVGCRVYGAWCRGQGVWCRVQGAGCLVQGAGSSWRDTVMMLSCPLTTELCVTVLTSIRPGSSMCSSPSTCRERGEREITGYTPERRKKGLRERKRQQVTSPSRERARENRLRTLRAGWGWSTCEPSPPARGHGPAVAGLAGKMGSCRMSQIFRPVVCGGLVVRDSGLGFRVLSFGFRVSGLGFRVGGGTAASARPGGGAGERRGCEART